MTTAKLAEKKCQPCEGDVPPLNSEQVSSMLKELPGWGYAEGAIEKTFRFKNFYETMAFANAVAWIANRQDHHPDMQLGYSRCMVRYSTHAINGLSENDFICAAKIEELVRDKQ